MTNTIIIFVNGILNRPGDSKAWTDRATAWVNGRTALKGEKFEYFAGVITRRLFQRSHAMDLAAEIAEFGADGDDLILVGHSNGCDLILRALAILEKTDDVPLIKTIHLISGACEPDFDANGLNHLLLTRNLRDVAIYVAGQDSHFCHPMWWAQMSQRFIAWAGLGYGTLGATGPLHVADEVHERVRIIQQPLYDHSSWFRAVPFQQLMMSITEAKQTTPTL